MPGLQNVLSAVLGNSAGVHWMHRPAAEPGSCASSCLPGCVGVEDRFICPSSESTLSASLVTILLEGWSDGLMGSPSWHSTCPSTIGWNWNNRPVGLSRVLDCLLGLCSGRSYALCLPNIPTSDPVGGLGCCSYIPFWPITWQPQPWCLPSSLRCSVPSLLRHCWLSENCCLVNSIFKGYWLPNTSTCGSPIPCSSMSMQLRQLLPAMLVTSFI